MHMPRDRLRRRVLHQLPRPPGKLLRTWPVPGEQVEQEGGREVHAAYDTGSAEVWDKFFTPEAILISYVDDSEIFLS